MKKLRIILSILLLLPALSAAQDHSAWTRNLAMYEVNIRQYTQEGTFEAFEAHLDRLQEMGVGILWLMPIHPIGEQNRLGTLGSYYSVRDYKGINPEFGDHEDFRRLINAIHDRGMYVILDWVPNHTSWDNYLTVEHPEWYATSRGNFMPPPGTNWSDVIQLDHHRAGLRNYMRDAMLFWVDEYGVDGFRFDAVSHVLDMDFLKTINEELVAHRPDLFLLAEHTGPEWFDRGFHMTHGWWLYGFGHGVLKQIADGQANANDLYQAFRHQQSIHPEGASQLYFTSNHDENSWQGTTRELFGDAAGVFAVLTATFDGMPLVYSGQEAGLDKRLAFFDKDLIPWRDHPKADLYAALFHLRRENQALWLGDDGGELQRVPTSSNRNVFAFIREKNDDQVLVAVNLSPQGRDVTLEGSTASGRYRDVLTGDVVTIGEDAVIALGAWDYVVYELLETGTSSDRSGESEPETDDIAAGPTLHQNYPNPFNPVTTISYTLAQPAAVTVEIFDMTGRRVARLVDGDRSAGRHQVTWDASGIGSGVYLLKIRAGDWQQAMKVTVVK